MPNIHTVVLYKNPAVLPMEVEKQASEAIAGTVIPREIIVIDPSNFTFSSHLSNFTAFNVRLSENATPFIVKTIHKTIQIYQPAVKPGPLQNEYRDCTDIAVKLAFAFNLMSTDAPMFSDRDGKPLDSQLKENLIIRNLSNNIGIDNGIIDTKLPLRIKQTSNYEVVEAFNIIERKLKLNINEVVNRNEEEYDEIYTCVHHSLKTSTVEAICLDDLLKCNARCVDFFQREHNELVELVGRIDMPKGAGEEL